MAKKPPEPKLPPDPAIERVFTREFEFGRFVAHGQTVLCPRCGKASLTFLGVTAFFREADGVNTSFVRVQHGIVTQHRMPQAPGDRVAPNDKPHHGVAAEFGCSQCMSFLEGLGHDRLGHGIFLEIVEAQGTCVLHWVYDPLPEGFSDARAAAIPPPGG